MPGTNSRHQGDEWVSALNGNGQAEFYFQQRFADHRLSNDFLPSFRHARTHLDLRCTGWSVLKAGGVRAFFLAGLLRRQHPNGKNFVRRVSGAGFSWQEAALLLMGEAIERDAQIINGIGKSVPGEATAFGQTYCGAATRAVLEAIERYYFHYTFINQVNPTILNISDDNEISEITVSLKASGRFVEYFSISQEQLFHVVLAVHMAGDRTTCGLGCSFDQRHAVRKALLEAVKCDIYISQGANIASDFDGGGMSPDAHKSITFWLNPQNRRYLNFLWGGGTRDVNAPARGLPDEQSMLNLLIQWADANGVSINVRDLNLPNGSPPHVCLAQCTWPTNTASGTSLFSKEIPLPIF
jgi:hypothetical protein